MTGLSVSHDFKKYSSPCQDSYLVQDFTSNIHDGWTEVSEFAELCNQLQRDMPVVKEYLGNVLSTRTYVHKDVLTIKGAFEGSVIERHLQQFCKE